MFHVKRYQCANCKCWLNTRQFDKTPTGRQKKQCRSCTKSANYYRSLPSKYGIDGEEYKKMLDLQGGKCFICHRIPRKRMLSVDHDHTTGTPRGLLCTFCNRYVLGHLKDDVNALQRAIQYLTTPPYTHPDVCTHMDTQ